MKSDLLKPNVEVRKSVFSGYGVFASKNLKKGEIIEECPVLLINKASLMPYQQYLFPVKPTAIGSSSENGFFLPLGYGCLYNHASLPNAAWDYDEHEKLMVFKTLKPLRQGDEVLIYFSSSQLSSRDLNQKTPHALTRKITTFLGRAGFVLFIFFVLKIALFPHHNQPIKNPASASQGLKPSIAP